MDHRPDRFVSMPQLITEVSWCVWPNFNAQIARSLSHPLTAIRVPERPFWAVLPVVETISEWSLIGSEEVWERKDGFCD
jgi:hypothetical protein